MGKWDFLNLNKQEKRPVFNVIEQSPKILLVVCTYADVKAETCKKLLELKSYKDVRLSIVIQDGDALITRARSKAASRFLLDTDYDILFFLDEDVVFETIDLLKICHTMQKENLDICGGAYPKKCKPSHFAIKLLHEKIYHPFGKNEGVFEIEYLSTGFMGIQRRVLQEMTQMKREDGEPLIPFCHRDDLKYYPFFDTMNKKLPNGGWVQLSEDWAFVERARQCGFKCWCDGSVKLDHIGKYRYTYNDIFSKEEKPITDFKYWEENYKPFFELKDVQKSKDNEFQYPPSMGIHIQNIFNGEYDIDIDVKNPTILDIGANVGAFSVWANKKWGGEVYAYEPIKINYDILVKNTLKTTIKLFNSAVRNIPEKNMIMNLGKNNCGECSFYDLGEQSEITESVSIINVKELPIADIIKIDTEGCEVEILEGLNLSKAKAVMMEIHRKEDVDKIKNILKDFDLFSIQQIMKERWIAKFRKPILKVV